MWLTKKFVMEEFATQVKQGNYKKIDYQTWRNLRDATPEEWDINIEVRHSLSASEGQPVKVVISWQHCIAPYEFQIDDNSFGKCLYDLLKPYLNSPYSVDTATVSNAMTEMAKSATTISDSLFKFKDSWDSAITHAAADLKSVKANITTPWDRAYPDICMEAKQDKAVPVVEITEKGINIQGKSINDTIVEKINEAAGFSINGKENDSMNLFKNFDFGSCENDNVKMSMYGIAVKNANGTWVAYDAKSESVVDVDILNFDAKYLYKMPVAIKDVKAGDVVIHNRKPMFVTVVEGGKLGAIDPAAGEEKVILLTKSMFGFDFVTKVVNLFGDLSATASADAPFGNMLPIMMLADGKNDDMLPLMFAMNGGKFDMSNPMMMYFLMKDSKGGNDMLPFLMMSNLYGNKCTCNCDCDREG